VNEVLNWIQAVFAEYNLLFAKLLVHVAIVAMVASLLLRFRKFVALLLHEHPGTRERTEFGLVLGVIAAAGAWTRINLGYTSADLLVVAPLLSGFIMGTAAGVWTGIIGGLVPLRHGELLAPVVGSIVGIGAGITRASLKDPGSIWFFSPVPFSDTVATWRRWRTERVLDPRLVVLLAGAGAEIFRTECARWTNPRWLFSYNPTEPVAYYIIVLMCLTSLGVSLKIWNTPRIEARLRRQEALLAEARLDALRDQINPHFLFNTLSTINSLIRTHPDQARIVIIKFSAILWRLLYSRENLCPLKAELDFVEDYLNIERIRFGAERLRLRKEISPDVANARVPMMLLQPIVENAVKHGIGGREQGGTVTIRARAEAETLAIEVEDDGVGMTGRQLEQSIRKGIGLSNIRERITSLYGESGHLSLQSELGKGTLVKILLPLDTSTGFPEHQRQAPAVPRVAFHSR